MEDVIISGIKANTFKIRDNFHTVLAIIDEQNLKESSKLLAKSKILKDLESKGLTKDSSVYDYIKTYSNEVDKKITEKVGMFISLKEEKDLVEKCFKYRQTVSAPAALAGLLNNIIGGNTK